MATLFYMGPSSPPKRGAALQFLADVYCGQTIAHLSYCWALVTFFYHSTSSAASVCSLSHWVPTFVYNTLAIMQSIARFVCDSWNLLNIVENSRQMQHAHLDWTWTVNSFNKRCLMKLVVDRQAVRHPATASVHVKIAFHVCIWAVRHKNCTTLQASCGLTVKWSAYLLINLSLIFFAFCCSASSVFYLQ